MKIGFLADNLDTTGITYSLMHNPLRWRSALVFAITISVFSVSCSRGTTVVVSGGTANGKPLPPGQAKKVYGGSATDYAPGQQKKKGGGM